jgi:hypothetical protein
LYSTTKITHVIKSREMRWAEHVVLWGRTEMHTGFCVVNLEEEDHMQHPGTDEGTVVKWVLKKQGRRLNTGLIWLSVGTSGRLL